MSIIQIQNSLAAGELTPSLFGRTDLQKWHSGTSTCRNFFVDYKGGVKSRAGLAYVGTCKQPGTSSPPRDIPFQFSLNQGYVLEFGDQYMRIKSNGAYVTEATKTISGITNANPAVLNIVGHGYIAGDWIYITGVVGMTNFNGLTWIVNTVVDANHITIKDLFGNVVNSTTFNSYISGGTSARLYTLVAPYAAVDLPYLKYTQSADTMTLTCVNTSTNTEYPSYQLVRSGNTSWAFTQDSFSSVITAPTGLSINAQSSAAPSTWYSYVVTAVSTFTGEESIASSPVSVQNNDIALYAGTNTISWAAVSGAGSYNIYKCTPSYGYPITAGVLFGFIGTAQGLSFSDTNITPDFTVVPPIHQNPFARGQISNITATAGGINYSQSTIGYSITTATGSGFVGTPIVVNGAFAGFSIQNHGQGYALTDTITLTDSGGGVATGNYLFNVGNPPDGSKIHINGHDITFIGGITTSDPDKVIIQDTLALTLQQLAILLNSSPIIAWNSASYTVDATHLYITYKTPGAAGNAFTIAAGSYGGTPSGANLTGGGTAGSGATGTLSIGAATGTYPAVCAYYQQRRVYASTLNKPDTYYMSQPGSFSNMDSSIPVTDADAIVGTPWAQQVNGIQWMVPMPGGLVVLTGKGAWQVNGGATAAITPSNQNATPQAYNGCNNLVPPIPVNYDIIYVQSKGSIVRDLSYNFFVNIYTGTDLTVLSNHLFSNYTLLQAAYAEEPFKNIWYVRNDGILLCLTYLKEQEVYSWTRHDTNGLFVGVCSVTELPVDAVYTITKRYVQGAWRYYSERFDNRLWTTVEDSFCVDSGLSSVLTYPSATLTASAASGSGVTFTASSGVFSSGNVGSVIRMGGGTATITSYTSSTVVTGTINTPITDTIPNDPNNMPIPASSGSWSIAPIVTTLSGLNHLEGLTVTILADGSVVPNQVVTNGSITLTNGASKIVVGLPYTCQVQTLYIDRPGDSNTSQNRRKSINSVGVRVESSRGLTIGADQPDASTQQNNASITWTDMNEIKERTSSVFAGNAIPLYTGDYYKSITSGWDVKGQIAIQQTYPLPANILSIISYWTLGDD